MCIGLPMQVVRVEPGHAWVVGRGQFKRINTALVGECTDQDWLLVFLDTARERIDAERAAEINTVLDLLQGALTGALSSTCDFTAEPGFVLPSSMDPTALTASAGAAS